mmetsp:Transcript_34276/g.56548  ORF Transcript_34276/g.56548 Transcript_34276/m.56548 type:complete len:212 (+) Transcript_34276:1387-2022(+)
MTSTLAWACPMSPPHSSTSASRHSSSSIASRSRLIDPIDAIPADSASLSCSFSRSSGVCSPLARCRLEGRPITTPIRKACISSPLSPPVKLSTSRPLLKPNTVGSPVTLSVSLRPRLASEFSLASRKSPPDFTAASSSAGVSCRQGAHQSAYTSSSTGTGESSTTFWRLSTVTSKITSSGLASLGAAGGGGLLLLPSGAAAAAATGGGCPR